MLNGFNHCHDLDPRFAKLIPSNQDSEESIESLLRRKGAPDLCHVMSDNADIDNREMPLSDALSKTVAMDAVHSYLVSQESWLTSRWKVSMEGTFLNGE